MFLGNEQASACSSFLGLESFLFLFFVFNFSSLIEQRVLFRFLVRLIVFTLLTRFCQSYDFLSSLNYLIVSPTS